MTDAAPALEGRRLFLENKYINDAFYTGRWNGVEAIEKVSSRATWLIGNEYRMTERMFAAAPASVPRPLACLAPGGGRAGASVVVERLPGPSLAEMLARGLAPEEADSFAGDMLALADALERTGIVHRDLFPDNFLLGADGRLKAIDWQLAVDRADFREDPWVRRHWKFRYVVFGVNRDLGLGVWNDFLAMDSVLALFPQTERVKSARASLVSRAPAMTVSDPPGFFVRMKLRLYAVSLRLQMLLRGRGHRKYAQLERRWRTIARRSQKPW